MHQRARMGGMYCRAKGGKGVGVMKRFMVAACIAVFVLGSVTACRGQKIPWKASGATEESAVAPGDLKAELPPAQYRRVVKPIEVQIARAEKAMESYDKEMEKPEEKRRQALLIKCKERAAACYLGASTAAKSALRLVKKDSHKAAIKQQYEQPNKEKAIDIYLELALDAHTSGDLRRTVGCYKKVLSIDRENTQARQALVKLAEQYQQAMKDRKKGGSKGGGGDIDIEGDIVDDKVIGNIKFGIF